MSEHDGKKQYAITPDGTAWLQANHAAVAAATARMHDVNATHGSGPAPEIIRAMENSKLALRLRQRRSPLDSGQARAVAAALDAAAIAAERS